MSKQQAVVCPSLVRGGCWSQKVAVVIPSHNVSLQGHLPARILPVSCPEPAFGLPAALLLSITCGAVQASWCEAHGGKKWAFEGLPVSCQLNQGWVSQGGSNRSCPALPCLQAQLQLGISLPVLGRFSWIWVSSERDSCSGCPRSGPALQGGAGWARTLARLVPKPKPNLHLSLRQVNTRWSSADEEQDESLSQ